MDKKVLGIVVVILVVGAVIGGLVVANKNKDKNSDQTEQTNSNSVENREIKSTEDAELTIFYGQGCPHCEKVEDYIIANNADEKVPLQMKEVWYNKTNADEMSAKADICKISKDELGVPFMFNSKNQKCYVGDVDIIDVLKTKIEKSSNENTNSQNSNSTNTNANENTNS